MLDYKCKKQKENKELFISTRKRKEKDFSWLPTLQEIILNPSPYHPAAPNVYYKGIFPIKQTPQVETSSIFDHINPPDISEAYIKRSLDIEEISDCRREIEEIKKKLKIIEDRQKIVNDKIVGEMGTIEGLGEVVSKLEGRLCQEFELKNKNSTF